MVVVMVMIAVMVMVFAKLYAHFSLADRLVAGSERRGAMAALVRYCFFEVMPGLPQGFQGLLHVGLVVIDWWFRGRDSSGNRKQTGNDRQCQHSSK
jgi:hypothetical protein